MFWEIISKAKYLIVNVDMEIDVLKKTKIKNPINILKKLESLNIISISQKITKEYKERRKKIVFFDKNSVRITIFFNKITNF